MESERSSFIPVYQELSDYHLAHRGRFLTSDRNKGHQRNTKQINNTSRLAVRTLASGMMAGITSPARPWFRLSSGDSDLDENTAVKKWLHQVQMIMYKVFSSSNTYNSLHTLYGELGVFGTASMGVFEDFENVIWCRPYTVGGYVLAADGKNQIDSFYREYDITVAQCVKQFGIDNCSTAVQHMWESGNTEAWVTVVHGVEPNDDRDQISPLAKDKRFRSVYYENSRQAKKNGDSGFLRESGFDDFPILSPRWDVTAEDIYATDCPGMIALGDVKALQLAEKRKYQAIDKLVSPPLQGPSSLKTKMGGAQARAGDIVWTDDPGATLSSIYGNYRPEIGVIKEEIRDAEGRISKAFYEDLFLMLSNSDRRQITAREVAEKHEEKLLMLGPVLERLHTELLDGLIDRTYNILEKNGVLPEPPEALQGTDMDVEYVSVLAQAQRLVATGNLERLTGFAGQVAQIWPDARHKIDALQAVDDFADALGVDPKVVRGDEEVQQIQQQEAQAAAQAQAAEENQQMAATAKDASEINTQGENGLTAMMRNAGLA